MYDIDDIIDKLDKSNDIQIQIKGIEMAKKVKSINAFIQPKSTIYYKNVWNNCAKVLNERTDEELDPYIEELLKWTKDTKLPGNLIIIERLKRFSKITYNFKISLIKCINIASANDDDIWLSNLSKLIYNKKIRYKLSNDIIEILKKYISIDIIEQDTTDNIDEIMELLDWNNDIEIQKKGIELAKNVKTINAFIQPCNHIANKNVWDNCAVILSNKTDKELNPYLLELLEWIQDINWPGALTIIERLKKFSDINCLAFNVKYCVSIAKVTNDNIWLSSIAELIENKKLKAALQEDTLEILKTDYNKI